MANIINDSNERVKSLLVKAEAMVHSRLELNTHSSVSEKAAQHVYDLRAAIAVRESLKHDLDEHRQRRGKLNELHDELNRAEEKLTELRLSVTEHEIEQEENLQKVADIEKQLGIMTDDFVTLKEAVVPLMDNGGFLRSEITRLLTMQSEAEAEVEKKRQQVRETEENLHHIMNAGLSSQMWTNPGSGRMGRRKSSFASPGQLASSTNGENLAGSFSMLTSGDEDEDMPNYAAQWTHKGDFVDVKIKTDEAARRMRYLQAEKKSRAQQLWTVAYNAIKLGLLTTRRLVFPRDTILKMQAYVHTEAMLMEANGAFRRKDQNPNQHLLDKITQLEEFNQRLQRQMEQKSSSGKKSEVKLAAMTTRYEKLRVEVVALRNVVATLGDKSVEQLIEENRRLDAERAILYAKLYGRKSKVEVPSIMDTQMLRESTAAASNPESPQNSPAKGGSPVGGSSPTRSRTVRDAVAAEQESVLRQKDAFYKAPHGIGFLQMQLDKHVANQQAHERIMDRAYKRTMEITHRLEVAEGLAMHAFDSFARGRQTADEELESLAMEMQRMQKRLNEKMAEEKKSYELQTSILHETITTLEREVDSSKNRIGTLEQTNDTLRSKVSQLEDDLEASRTELEDSRRAFLPEDLHEAASLIEKLNRYNASDAVAYDFAIPRILPMKSQRAVTSLVTNLIQAVHPPLIVIANNFHRVLKDSLRKTPASVSQTSTVVAQLLTIFDQVTSNIALIARTELEAIENFEEHRRATLTHKETDVEDLPQPPPTVVEVTAAPLIPPDTEDVEVQAGPARVHVHFAEKSCEAEIKQVPSCSHVSSATDLVLGTGNAEAMGFASLDNVKRMEEILRKQMRANAEALEETKLREEKLRNAKIKLVGSLASFEKQVMTAEDCSARAVRVMELEQSRQVNRCVANTQVDHELIARSQQDSSFQVYFRECDEQRLAPFAVGNVSSGRASNDANCEAFVDLDRQGNVLGNNQTSTAKEADTSESACQTESSSLEQQQANSNNQNGASPAEQNLFPTFVPIRTEASATTPHVSAVAPVTGVEATPLHMLQAPNSSAASLPLHSAMEQTQAPMAPLSGATTVECAAQTDPVTIYDTDFGESSFVEAISGKDTDGVDAGTSVDPTVTQQMLNEMQEAMEVTLREEYEKKREVLEQKLGAREAEVQSQSDDIQRQALQMHLQVSDMQNGYEAVNASVNKFKFVAKRLLTTLQENRVLKKANDDLQQQLGASVSIMRHPQATAIFDGTTTAMGDTVATSVGFKPMEKDIPVATVKTGKKATFAEDVVESSPVAPAVKNVAPVQASTQPSLRRVNSLLVGGGRNSTQGSSKDATSASNAAATQEVKTLRRERDTLTIQLETQKRHIADLEARLKSLEAELPIHPNLTTKKRTVSTSLARVAHKYSLSLSHADIEAAREDDLKEQRPATPGRSNSPTSPTSPGKDGMSLMDAFTQRMETKVRDSNFSLLALTSELKEEKQKRIDETSKLTEELTVVTAALTKLRQEETTWKAQLNKTRKDAGDVEGKIRSLLEPQISSIQQEKDALETTASREAKKFKREENRLNDTIDKLSSEILDARDAQRRAEDSLKRYVSTSTGKVKSVVILVPKVHSAVMEAITQIRQLHVRNNEATCNEEDDATLRADFQLSSHLLSLLDTETRGGGTTAEDPSIDQADKALANEKTMIRLATNVVDQDVRLLRHAIELLVQPNNSVGEGIQKKSGYHSDSLLLLQAPPHPAAPVRSPRLKPQHHIQSGTGSNSLLVEGCDALNLSTTSAPPLSVRGKIEVRTTKQQTLKEKLVDPVQQQPSHKVAPPHVPDSENALFSLAPIAHLSPPPSSQGARQHSSNRLPAQQFLIRPSSVQGNFASAVQQQQQQAKETLTHRSQSAMELTPPRATGGVAPLHSRPMKDFLGRTAFPSDSDSTNGRDPIGPVVNIRVPTQAALPQVEALPHAVHDGLPARGASRQSDRLSRLRKTV